VPPKGPGFFRACCEPFLLLSQIRTDNFSYLDKESPKKASCSIRGAKETDKALGRIPEHQGLKPQISQMNADLIFHPVVKESLTAQSVAKGRSLA
jgi:hypothetical protein